MTVDSVTLRRLPTEVIDDLRHLLAGRGKPIDDAIPPDRLAFLCDAGLIYLSAMPHGTFAHVKAKGCHLLKVDPGNRA